ncbi:hypothetical protein [Micromonospora sp. NPDC049107]|uniref:hypothetical protein n=1 Tax=Micromonospora sp. NPDC049107 TaxID=3154349 RepID=UPI00340AC3F2
MLMRKALATVLLMVGLVLTAPTVPAVAAPDETGRYYVVGPPVNGQREYLYDIALRTLGNGNRFREITQLNIGRKQPDGGTFTDGVELRPGWLLVLPRDARGSGVRSGALPTIGVKSSPPGGSAAAPKPSTTAVKPSSTASSAVARSPTPAPAVTESAAAPRASGNPDAGRFAPLLVRGGAGILAIVLAMFAVLTLRRGGYRLRTAALDDTGPWPPERHHTPAPAEVATDTVDGATAAAPLPQETPAPPRASPPSSPSWPLPPSRTVPPPRTPTPTALPSEPQALEPLPAESLPAEPRAAEPLRAESRAAEPLRAEPLRAEPLRAEPLPAEPRAVGSRPAALAPGEVPYLRADLLSEEGPVHVRLVGAAKRRETPAYAWLGETEPAPPATVPLVLGRQGPWRLHVDLGQVPDVLTVVGALDVCQRLATALARRLHSEGVRVAVVGEALGAVDLNGYETLPGLPSPPPPGEGPPDPCVIFVAGLPAGAADDMRGLAAATGGRYVPVVVGPIPGGRWSVRVGDGG